MVVKVDEASTMDINIKNNNDPWLPLPDDETLPYPQAIMPAPRNPLTEMIDSERYIQTLERKLKQLTKVPKVEPSSKDIITSLAMFHDDQMRRYISETDIIDLNLASSSRADEPIPQTSFVQRKLHPERQPMSAEEIAELIKEDVLAKVFEDAAGQVNNMTTINNSIGGTQHPMTQKSSNSQQVLGCSANIDQYKQDCQESCSKADDWANFDELNNEIQDVDDSVS